MLMQAEQAMHSDENLVWNLFEVLHRPSDSHVSAGYKWFVTGFQFCSGLTQQ